MRIQIHSPGERKCWDSSFLYLSMQRQHMLELPAHSLDSFTVNPLSMNMAQKIKSEILSFCKVQKQNTQSSTGKVYDKKTAGSKNFKVNLVKKFNLVHSSLLFTNISDNNQRVSLIEIPIFLTKIQISSDINFICKAKVPYSIDN